MRDRPASPLADVASSYMALSDLRETHTRRVRVMVIAACVVMIGAGLAYAVFFALRGDWFVTAGELLIVLVGVTGAWMAAKGRTHGAATLLTLSLYLVFVAMALVMDLPSTAVPRSVHHFLIPLAVASYLMHKDESRWLQHGIPVLCLATMVVLASTDFGLRTSYAVPDDVRSAGIWANNTIAVAVLYLLVHIFAGDINRMESYLHSAHNRFVGLVGGMFPTAIAERLLSKGETFAERHSDCSILFADIVGFTHISETMQPERLVDMLSQVFAGFDLCVQERGLTKIKTIGDAYMVASGVPEPHPDHAGALVELAQSMLSLMADFDGIELRIGIASGELVAGVIGQSRQVYDVWGDVVNMAARMESHGVPGCAQVSASTYALTRDRFDYDRRSGITIKGKDGVHDVFVLLRRQPQKL